MADGVNAVEGEVDDEPPTMSYPLITVSDLPSSTTAGIYNTAALTACCYFYYYYCYSRCCSVFLNNIPHKRCCCVQLPVY